ncbi:MAG TPA: class I adenylate-forming enzyme family protein, partial [Pseudolabrys sp.]|nr:class I adenylate-forming enzyme family protein [Pseudolabrys sp.]
MILGETNRASGITTTLDDLFRRAGVRRPDAPALVDPPNRSGFTDGPPRTLSYAEADRAISAVAARLRGLGLQTDAVVAIQLPNTVESVVAYLGVLRAGMIAAPLPLLWRRRDLVDCLGRVSAKAIVTCARVGRAAPAELAMHTAAALFPIRHIFGFGQNLPDGIVPIDAAFAPGDTDAAAMPVRPDSAATHVAAITFGVDARGIAPAARNHTEFISGGLAVFLEAGIAPNACLLSTIPISSFAGAALTLVPWLLSGGTLHLHHGFDSTAFAAQRDTAHCDMLALPA